MSLRDDDEDMNDNDDGGGDTQGMFPSWDYDPSQRVYSYDELQRIFCLVVHPLWIFDYLEGRMRWANRAGCAVWNAKSLEELQSRSFQDTSSASARRMDGYLAQFERGKHVQDQWTIYPNGKATTIHINLSGIQFAEDGCRRHFCLLCEGVPVVSEALSQESLRGVEMIRHLPMAVCQFDMEGKIMFQNPEAMIVATRNSSTSASTTGEAKEAQSESIDRSDHSMASLMDSKRTSSTAETNKCSSHSRRQQGAAVSSSAADHDDLMHRFIDSEVAWQALREIQSPRKTQVDMDAMVKTREGAKWSAIQLRKGKDPVTGETVILYSARDKSDAVKARKEREARERKSEFLAIMAHEIRTPLHQVTGFIDLLAETILSPEQKSYIRLLKSSAQGLMTVISDVLDYSKLEAGKMRLERIPYEPLSVAEGSMAAVRGSCEEKGIHLKLDWDKGIPYKLKGDPNRLRQILLNLLSNATKFTKEGGITIKGMAFQGESPAAAAASSSEAQHHKSKSHPMIRFEVHDTGVGIDEAHKELIFAKYHQANNSVARNFGGTGLGLSICHLLALNMGGTIGVESELGKGTMFWVNLPADIAQEVAPGEEACENDAPVAKVQGLHVLVAEDNKVNQKLLSNMLKRMGHNSEMAINGKEAMDMVIQKQQEGSLYDVVLMDIQMPVMDGLEATRRLRALGFEDLPIYGLTASVARNDYQELGFDDWIGKPIPMKDLKFKLYQLQLQHIHEKNESSTLSAAAREKG